MDGSFQKVKDWKVTPRIDLVEDEYCGESATDLDVQVNGYDFTFSVDTEDEKCIDFLTDIVSAEEQGLPHPTLVFFVIMAMRKPGAQSRTLIYHDIVMKVAEEGAGGRKERVGVSFEGKAKFRDVVNG